MVWACDVKRGTLRRKGGNGNESTGEKIQDKVKDDIKEKALSADEVYDRATCRRTPMSSYIAPT